MATEGSETIDGAGTGTIADNYGCVTYYSDGTNWFTVPLLAVGSHTLASHSTKAHSDLTGIGAGDHHAQAHSTDHEPAGADAMAVDVVVGTGSLRTLGTGAQQAAAGGHTHTGFAKIATGSYTGDGATSQAITGVGFQPKVVWIVRRFTADTVLADRELMFTSDTIVDDNAAGMAINMWSGSAIESSDNAIISLDSDGFTVDDEAADKDPNANGIVYNYIAWG